MEEAPETQEALEGLLAAGKDLGFDADQIAMRYVVNSLDSLFTVIPEEYHKIKDHVQGYLEAIVEALEALDKDLENSGEICKKIGDVIENMGYVMNAIKPALQLLSLENNESAYLTCMVSVVEVGYKYVARLPSCKEVVGHMKVVRGALQLFRLALDKLQASLGERLQKKITQTQTAVPAPAPLVALPQLRKKEN